MSELKPFGRSGLFVSPMGLGTSHLASLSNPHSPADMACLLDQAYEQGLRFFDTADVYGQGDAERLLSRVACKDDVVVCTKAGLGVGRTQPIVRLVKPMLRPLLSGSRGARRKVSEVRKSREVHDLDTTALERRFLASLKRLKRDHVDIFMLHSPPVAALADGRLYDFLDSLRIRGLARVTGVSVQSIEDALPVIQSNRVAALQIPVSSQSLAAAQPVLRAVSQTGAGVIAREVLLGAPDPSAALATVLSNPLISVSLVGTTSAEHLAENAAIMKKFQNVS